MKLSVIIPCYNSAATIGAQLEALSSQIGAEPWEVIVADNGSTDASRSIVEQYRGRLPQLRLIDAADRRGAAHARNAGAAAATGDALAFCDSDDEVAPDWLCAMRAALVQHGFVGCRMDFDKLNPDWLRKAFPSPQAERLPSLWFLPSFRIAGGGSLGIARRAHEMVGGFDESWAFLEEADYSVRVQRAGVPLHFAKDAVSHCRLRQTLRGVYRQGRSWAPYSIRVFKTYRPAGRYRWFWKWYAGQWPALLHAARHIDSPAAKARFVWDLAWQVGRLQGSIRYGAPPVPFP